MHQRVAPEKGTRVCSTRVGFELVAKAFAGSRQQVGVGLEGPSLSRGKGVACNKRRRRQEVGLKQGSLRNQGKDYLGQETNLWKENQYFVVSKIKFTSWPLHGRWSLHR